jgi:hypothetical protein
LKVGGDHRANQEVRNDPTDPSADRRRRRSDPRHHGRPPIAVSDILLVQADPAATDADTKSNTEESAKMGKEAGTHSGENQGATPESDTSKIDQPARANPTTGNQ